jgi:hypothetical protein
MRWERNVAVMEEEVRNAYKLLIGKPELKRLFGRVRNRQEDESMVRHEGVDCICVLRK